MSVCEMRFSHAPFGLSLPGGRARARGAGRKEKKSKTSFFGYSLLMNTYIRLKNLVKHRLRSIPKDLCENCCLEREHSCIIEEFHVLHNFDYVFGRRRNVQKYRLQILEELLLECVQNREDIITYLISYQEARPWVIDLNSNKENVKP